MAAAKAAATAAVAAACASIAGGAVLPVAAAAAAADRPSCRAEPAAAPHRRHLAAAAAARCMRAAQCDGRRALQRAEDASRTTLARAEAAAAAELRWRRRRQEEDARLCRGGLARARQLTAHLMCADGDPPPPHPSTLRLPRGALRRRIRELAQERRREGHVGVGVGGRLLPFNPDSAWGATVQKVERRRHARRQHVWNGDGGDGDSGSVEGETPVSPYAAAAAVQGVTKTMGVPRRRARLSPSEETVLVKMCISSGWRS